MWLEKKYIKCKQSVLLRNLAGLVVAILTFQGLKVIYSPEFEMYIPYINKVTQKIEASSP